MPVEIRQMFSHHPTAPMRQVHQRETSEPRLAIGADRPGAQPGQPNAPAAESLLVSTSQLQFNKDSGAAAPDCVVSWPPGNSPTSDQGGLLAVCGTSRCTCNECEDGGETQWHGWSS